MHGLSKDKVEHYWAHRAAKHGARTVGYSNKDMGTQDARYLVKKEFVAPYIDRSLHTLDYGCGIGRWADQFDNYVGVDITTALLELARKFSPEKTFLQLREPTLFGMEGRKELRNVEQFFSATVLQHCDDELLMEIFRSFHAIRNCFVSFVFYENSQVKAAHVNGRKPAQYLEMLGELFDVKAFGHESHKIHGEQHSITRIMA